MDIDLYLLWIIRILKLQSKWYYRNTFCLKTEFSKLTHKGNTELRMYADMSIESQQWRQAQQSLH
jgi:hypothetical protein